MRLLHTRSYQLETFLGTDTPPYAILSHTWGQDEFVFEDLKIPIVNQLDNPKRGLQKVLQTCAVAIKDGYDYVWIDTCCIDKSSSAELSEAINSMFEWYRKSSNCYVWLEDVTLCKGAAGPYDSFEDSKWFCRGWTLQELIAPHDVTFYDSNWNLIDDRYALAGRISSFTNIMQEVLQRRHRRREDPDGPAYGFSENLSCSSCGGKDNLKLYLWKTPTATRMAWAARRLTSRAEDEAYCLLGLFDVNMPLLYGEGRNRAFRRLLFEMLQHNQADSSILLWQTNETDTPWLCLPMGLGPNHFLCGFSSLHLNPMWPRPDLMVTPRGLEVSAWLAPSSAFSTIGGYAWESKKNFQLAVLSLGTGRDRSATLGIFVTPTNSLSITNEMLYTRAAPDTIVELREAPGGYAAATILDGSKLFWSSVTSGSRTGDGKSNKQHTAYLRTCTPSLLQHHARSAFSKLTSFAGNHDGACIHQSEFVLTRIMLSIRQEVPYSVTKASVLSVDARNCGPYSIHIVVPTAENLTDQHRSILYFDDVKDWVNAADAVIIAFTTADLSSGFFVMWRDGANQHGGKVAVKPWPSLAYGHSTPAVSLGGLWNLHQHLRDMQCMLHDGAGYFSEHPAVVALEEGGTCSCLRELNARAMVVRQSFLGNERCRLLVEVGPAVPKTEHLWVSKGVNRPKAKGEDGNREEGEPDEIVGDLIDCGLDTDEANVV